MNQPELETKLELRVAILEAQVVALQKRAELNDEVDKRPWWEKIRGTFADDELFDEAMRLGREYRVNTKIEDEFDEE